MYVITGKIGKKYLKNISRVRTNTAMRRRRLVYEGTKRKKLHFGAPDKEYGLAEPLLETLSEEQLNEKKLDFINKLSLVNNIDIEKKQGNKIKILSGSKNVKLD